MQVMTGTRPTTIRFGEFELDTEAGELRKSGLRIHLQEQPFRILLKLLEQPGKTVSHEELKAVLSPQAEYGDFDQMIRLGIWKLRSALKDDAQSPKYIETVPMRGYRFIGEIYRDVETHGERSEKTRSWHLWTVISLIACALIVGGVYLRFGPHHRGALDEKHTIVLADFDNKTGEVVFDDALKQGLAVQLEQSPFLALASEAKLNETLKLMGRNPREPLSYQTAREVCQRSQSTVVIAGSIAKLGSQYVIGLKAVNCNTGDALAEVQKRAASKEAVLKELDAATIDLRTRLGESLASLEKYSMPLEQVTTPSLEALQAFSMAQKLHKAGDWGAAIAMYQRAIGFDPNFAMAYASLSQCYGNTNEYGLSVDAIEKAYELRDRASERERFYIEATYYRGVPGAMEKSLAVLETWAQVYPRDQTAQNNQAVIYRQFGQYQKALEHTLQERSLEVHGVNYGGLTHRLVDMDRLDEAQATVEEAQAKGFDSPGLRVVQYQLAFLRNDVAAMAQQTDWAVGKPDEAAMLDLEASTAAYLGQLTKSRELARRATAFAERLGNKELAARYEAHAAWREALLGNASEARQKATSALALSSVRQVQCNGALVLAVAGDNGRAETLAHDLAKRFPEDTGVQSYCLPTLQAQIAFNRNDLFKTVEFLQAAAPYELGMAEAQLFYSCLYPVYLRGEAYLTTGQDAPAEFHKILDHRGIVRNCLTGALARLELARAYASTHDEAKAREAYADFLALWKDADPDLPLLKQAKSEYAKLAN